MGTLKINTVWWLFAVGLLGCGASKKDSGDSQDARCEEGNFTALEVQEAFEASWEEVSVSGVELQDLWEDDELARTVIDSATRRLGCNPDAAFAVTSARRHGSSCELVEVAANATEADCDSSTCYCGRGAWRPQECGGWCDLYPGECLNTVCWVHDRDYARDEVDFIWSAFSLEPDNRFFEGFCGCRVSGQCGLACWSVAYLAAFLRSQLGSIPVAVSLFCLPSGEVEGPCRGVVCDDPPSACYETPGTCVNGMCEYAYVNGVACDDGDLCTVDDMCENGVCVGSDIGCWSAMSTVTAPSARSNHSAIWTGEEMIVWGGYNGAGTFFNSGGRYNPATDTWTATVITGAPSPRYAHTAIWTGTAMIVWGGSSSGATTTNTGGRYNPASDSWISTSITNVPTARNVHTAIWTGEEMIVWGGYGGGRLNTGGRYNPTTNSWESVGTVGAPSPRSNASVVWTGSKMIVWGGCASGSTYCVGTTATGGLYNPASDGWTVITIVEAPSDRGYLSPVWTGSEMIVWGGWSAASTYWGTGGRYNPLTNAWESIMTDGAPSARADHVAVWTGGEMVIWGGWNSSTYFSSGGKYDPVSNDWVPMSTVGAPVGRLESVVVWTGAEVIVWGGCTTVQSGSCTATIATGGRYTP